MLKLGNVLINKLYLGSTEINKSYLGSVLVHDKTVIPLYNNISVTYTLRKPAMTVLWTNAVLKVRRASDNSTAYVFFEGTTINSNISLNSLISTSSNTTPSVTTLSTWVGSGDAYVEEWIGITDDNTIDTDKTAVQTTTTLQPNFIDNGVIKVKNGKPAIDFTSTSKYLSSNANTDLNYNNSFSLISVHNQESDPGQRLWATSTITGGRLLGIAGRGAGKSMFIAINTSDSTLKYINQADTSNQKLLTLTTNGNNFSGYYNGTFQDQNTGLATYNNNVFQIGAERNGLFDLNGTIQEIIIFPSDKTTDLTALHADINAYYSIY